MTKFKFWNEVCKYGAIIGLVMSVAFVIEQSLMLSGWVFDDGAGVDLGRSRLYRAALPFSPSAAVNSTVTNRDFL